MSFSGPTVHLKLEGLSWLCSLGLQIFARLETHQSKSLENHLNVPIMLLLAASQGEARAPYRHVSAVAWNRDIIFQGSFCLKNQVFWFLTPNNFLLKKFQFFHHAFSLFCCDRILMVGFAQAFSSHFSWKSSFYNILHLNPSILSLK